MPLSPGAWQASPGPLTIAGPNPSGTGSNYTLNDLVDYPTACEPIPADTGYGVSGTMRTSYDGVAVASIVEQLADDIRFDGFEGGPFGAWSPPLPWPSGAVDWEWDPAVPVDDWVTGWTATLTADNRIGADTATVVVVPADPASLTVIPSGTFTGLPETRAVPGAALSPIVATLNLPLSGSVTVTTDMLPTSWIKNYGDAASFSWPARLVLAFDNQRTHVPPPFGVTLNAQLLDTTTTVYFTPPRWRFLYAARPPLAHRQRRDGTATSGPQLAHIGTTGGRPPLAWRQNNP